MRRAVTFMAVLTVLLSACSTHRYRVADGRITLYLKVPEAETVYLVTSRNGFERQQARKLSGETWEVSVAQASEFTYFYLVDGRVFIPDCRLKESDDFGRQNCIFSSAR